MTQVAASSTALTLRGSVAMVTEFFGFAVNSILYQRAVYPPGDFQQVTKYGLPLFVSTDAALNEYMAEILGQLAVWLGRDEIRRFVLVVTNPDTDAVLERWSFDVRVEQPRGSGPAMEEQGVRKEIQALMRQITAAVTFLPVLDGPFAFDLLVYTALNVEVPSNTWELSDPRHIEGSDAVRLRSFSTCFHHIDTTVTYRN